VTRSLFTLDGRLALITGSGQGIGLALARGLAEHGASVVLNGRTIAKIDEGVRILRDAGFKAHAAQFDVADAASIKPAIARIEAEVGPIDILVNNAGVQHRAPLEEFPEQEWDRLIRTNLTGAFLVSRAVAPAMIARGAGKIINIGSVQSELARANIAPYTATKGAIRNLTRGMCADWARYGLQVNAIAPGYFRTELNKALMENPEFCAWLEQRTPARRWGEVNELVGAAVFLASDASSFVNGHTLYVDGGIVASI